MGEAVEREWLQRLLDGEVDGAARQELEARLAQDPEAQVEWRRLVQLRELMLQQREAALVALDSEALFARITAGLEAEGAAPPQAVTPQVSAAGAGRQRSSRRGLRGWQRWFRDGFALPVGGAVVALGALWLWVQQPSATELERMRRAGQHGTSEYVVEADSVPKGQKADSDTDSELRAVPGEELAAASGIAGPAGAEVVQVEFGVTTGTVFEIALASGRSVPVLWINDED